ncbi:MAG: hypothetical protein IKE41_02195 [Clostridia bacterium]|nr:hypothetical protein [Clostridia bacterium]MBR2735360.1 hypothetical protein [Clostridia bacterium]
MEDMISRIIERDREARASLTEVRQLRIDSEQKISDMKAKKRDEYLERARANIKALEKSEKVKAAIKFKAIENSYTRKTENMEKIYAENSKKWTDELFERVVER